MNTMRSAARLVQSLMFLVVLPVAATSAAQEPTIKPTPEPTATVARLPVPTGVTARQRDDGTIEVRWNAVQGAVRYDLWRSVPPGGQTLINRPDPAATTYIDTDVKVGSTYYYVVAAVNTNNISGLKAGAQPVTPTIAVSGLRTSDPPESISTTTPVATTATAVPAHCEQTGAYSTCTTDTIQFSPLVELSKKVVVACPQPGQVATGGGFAGNLLNMSVVASIPIVPTAKTTSGWIVQVVPNIKGTVDPVTAIQELIGTASRSIAVFVICAAAGATP
jgi:hypothetical protein